MFDNPSRSLNRFVKRFSKQCLSSINLVKSEITLNELLFSHFQIFPFHPSAFHKLIIPLNRLTSSPRATPSLSLSLSVCFHRSINPGQANYGWIIHTYIGTRWCRWLFANYTTIFICLEFYGAWAMGILRYLATRFARGIEEFNLNVHDVSNCRD